MIKEKDKVGIIKEPETIGFVMNVDNNLKDVTTCSVVWGYNSYKDALTAVLKEPKLLDTQWTNKLFIV